MTIEERFVVQLDELLAEWSALVNRSKYDDASDLPDAVVTRFISRAEAAIQRIAGRPSPYVDQSDRIFKAGGDPGYLARALSGILQSLRSDVAAGYVRSQRELLHAELFADFLEMVTSPSRKAAISFLSASS